MQSRPGTPFPCRGEIADELENHGFRVLAVAAGPPASMQLIGFIALSDPPRTDSASLISELMRLGCTHRDGDRGRSGYGSNRG